MEHFTPREGKNKLFLFRYFLSASAHLNKPANHQNPVHTCHVREHACAILRRECVATFPLRNHPSPHTCLQVHRWGKGPQPAPYLLPFLLPPTSSPEGGCRPPTQTRATPGERGASWGSSVGRGCQVPPEHGPPALCRRNNHLVYSSHKYSSLCFLVLPAELTSNLNFFLLAQENISEEILTSGRPPLHYLQVFIQKLCEDITSTVTYEVFRRKAGEWGRGRMGRKEEEGWGKRGKEKEGGGRKGEGAGGGGQGREEGGGGGGGVHTLKWPGPGCRYTGKGGRKTTKAIRLPVRSPTWHTAPEDNGARHLTWRHRAQSNTFRRLSPYLPHFPLKVEK